LQENIRANLCKLLDAHPSVINIKVCCCWHGCRISLPLRGCFAGFTAGYYYALKSGLGHFRAESACKLLSFTPL
jgi:hypothetical protein